MYVIVAYDADPEEQHTLRRALSKQLSRIQNSVYAGSLTRVEVDAILRVLTETVDRARVQVWVVPDEPAIHQIGAQADNESSFV